MNNRQDVLLFIALLLLSLVSVASFNLDLSSVGQLAAAKVAKPTKGILVILVDYVNAKHDANSDTAATIKQKIDALNAYYSASSYGAFSNLTYDVTPWVQSTDYFVENQTNAESINVDLNLEVQGENLAINLGYNPFNYNTIFVVTSKHNSTRSYSGLSYGNDEVESQLLSKGSKLIFINGNNDGQAYIHEFGHRLGLRHFGGIKCRGYFDLALTGCKAGSYGLTAMGQDFTSLSAAQRLILGFISPNNLHYVSQSGTYTLSTIDSPTLTKKSIKALRINNLFIEYRTTGIAADAGGRTWVVSLPQTFAGIDGIKEFVDPSSPLATDAFQIDSNTSLDGALPDGVPFYDQPDNVTITQVSHTATDAQIKVDFGQPPVFSLGAVNFGTQNAVGAPNHSYVVNNPITATVTGTNLPPSGFNYSVQITEVFYQNSQKNGVFVSKAVPFYKSGPFEAPVLMVESPGNIISTDHQLSDVYAQVFMTSIVPGSKAVVYTTNHIYNPMGQTPLSVGSIYFPTDPSVRIDSTTHIYCSLIFKGINGSCSPESHADQCREFSLLNRGSVGPGCTF